MLLYSFLICWLIKIKALFNIICLHLLIRISFENLLCFPFIFSFFLFLPNLLFLFLFFEELLSEKEPVFTSNKLLLDDFFSILVFMCFSFIKLSTPSLNIFDMEGILLSSSGNENKLLTLSWLLIFWKMKLLSWLIES